MTAKRQATTNSKDDLVKVGFRDEDGDVETLWAVRLGADRYKLDNVPFFQYGVSWCDVVEAVVEEADGFPFFKRVLEKSGHRTMRILFDEERDEKDAFFSHLTKMGCTIERATPRFIAINVPPGIDLRAVAKHLATSGADWEPADPPWDELQDAGGA